MLGGELAEHLESERREVSQGLVQRPDQILETRRGVGHRQLELVVVGADRACDLPCIGELRPVAVLDEAHRERLHRLAHVARHHGDEEARVEPSTQHGPERDVAHQAELHGILELLPQQLGGRGLREALVRVRMWKGPVRRDVDAAVDHQPVARLQLPHPGERRRRPCEEPEGQVCVDRFQVEVGLDEAARQHRFQLGGEDEEIADDGEVERFDAETVACDQRAAALAVPDGDAELPPQPARKRVLDLLVEVGEDLGVAAATEAVAAPAQVVPNGVVVVQLAVLDRPDRFVLVSERLMTVGDVDDAQTADAERDAGSREEAAVVRAAVGHHVRHALEHFACDDLPRGAADLDDTADSTHIERG